MLTQNVVEAMRRTGARRILYASGSGVYGDLGELEANEDHGPMIPVSTYGASKLAGEALISSYGAMFDSPAAPFVRQRRRTSSDPRRRFRLPASARGRRPTTLTILGDGPQSKSYIHVSDYRCGDAGRPTG